MATGKLAASGNRPHPRIPSGIPGLDRLIEGGYPRNSSLLIRGDTGTAKTIFCLQFLYSGAKDHDEPGVIISFAESRDAIFDHGVKLGWNLEGLSRKKVFDVIRYEPHEVVRIMEEGGGMIRDTIESIGAKRLVIDSLTAYEMFFENKYKSNESILSLFEMLKKWNVTSLVTSEMPLSITSDTHDRLGFLTEGIINLYHARSNYTRIRALEILKMRDTIHNENINIFSIGRNGIEVYNGLKGPGFQEKGFPHETG